MRSSAPRGRWRRAFSSTWRRPILTLALLVLLLLPPYAVLAAGGAASNNPGSRANADLLAQAQANPDQTFRVIVQGIGSHGHDAAARAVAAKGKAALKDVGDLGVVTQVKGRDVADLATGQGVKYVAIDAPLQVTATCYPGGPINPCNLQTVYPAAIRATNEWQGMGYTGKGVGVAVVDTGISPKADFNSGAGTSRIVANQDFSSTSGTVNDVYGHGTHVAGIIAGNSWNGSSDQGQFIGVAPNANLINVKVTDDNGMAYTSDLVNAIDWVIANRVTYNIRVMNLSLVQSTPESYSSSILDAEVERAWFNGIFVSVAAGNTGANTALYPPMNDPFVFTTGAADTVGTASQSDDTTIGWSTYGTTQDGFSKPDALAPGRQIYSVNASATSVLALDFPTRLTADQAYLWLSGTSMAAPVVSGAAALIFQAHPEYTNDQVKWLLMNQADLLGTRTWYGFNAFAGQGAGEIDVYSALSYGKTPQYANQGVTISGQLTGPNGATTYSNGMTSSWSTSSWSTSSWSTSSWSTSSWSTSSWSTSSGQ